MEVPAIVSEAELAAVQRSLKARNPKMMPPMAVGGPTLLTGICFCACCGGAMTLRTGTSRVGHEYRYYTCSTKARQGAKGYPGITVPTDRLNKAVVDHIEARLLDPERLEALMDQILERRDVWVNQRREHVADLERRTTEAEAKLKRLYEAIENGVVDVSDTSLKDRVAELAATRDQAKGDAERALVHIVKIGPAITPESLRAFAAALRKKLRNGDGTFARDQVRAVAQRVEVVSKRVVRIRGLRSELLRTLTAASGVEAAVLGVHSFEPKWRAARKFETWLDDELEEISSEDLIDLQLFLRWQLSLGPDLRDVFNDIPELVELTGTDGRRRRYNVIPARRDGRVGWIDPAGFELAKSNDIFDEFGPGAIRSDYELRTGGLETHVHRSFAAED